MLKRILLMFSVTALFVLALAVPAYAVPSDSGGCPDITNPQGHLCANPHSIVSPAPGRSAIAVPSCKSPNAFKQTNVCRGEL
jgi:hypothetical protein